MKRKLREFIYKLLHQRYLGYPLVGFSLLLVLTHIGSESLWFDEIYSATMSTRTQSLQEMFSVYIFGDVHPPMFQVALYYWSKLFGDSDIALRLMSYTFVLLSVLAGFNLLRKRYSQMTANIYLAITVVTPAVSFYSQEVRSYGMMFALANLASIYFLIFLRAIKGGKPIPGLSLALFTLIGTMLTLTHYFGYLLMFSIYVTIILFSLKKRSYLNLPRVLYSGTAVGSVGLAWLYIVYAYSSIEEKSGGNFWITNDYLVIFGGFLGIMFGSLLAVIYFPFFIFKMRSRIRSYFSTWKWIALPVVLTGLISFLVSLHTPIMTFRNFMVVVPLLLILFTFAIVKVLEEKKLVRTSVLFILSLALSSIWFNNYFDFVKKENWRDASGYIAKIVGENPSCKIPIPKESKEITANEKLMYWSYYLWGHRKQIVQSGPLDQQGCRLLYADGHELFPGTKTTRDAMETKLKKLQIPYEIVEFRDVYVAVKRQRGDN